MIILDASVLIGHFELSDEHYQHAYGLLRENKEQELGSSAVTLGEVYAGFTADQAAQAETALTQLGEIRFTTRLKMPDCCVLFTAELHDAPVATFDQRLIAAAQAIGVTTISAGPNVE